MIRKMRLRAPISNSRLTPANSRYEALARECTQRASDLAAGIMAREWSALEEDGTAQLLNDETMHSITLPFLWGIFHELALEYPEHRISALDMIKVHLIRYLVTVHGCSLDSLDRARSEVNGVEDWSNKADMLFDVIADCGKEAFHGRKAGGLSHVVQSLGQSRGQSLGVSGICSGTA
jgi:hypothetical protein